MYLILSKPYFVRDVSVSMTSQISDRGLEMRLPHYPTLILELTPRKYRKDLVKIYCAIAVFLGNLNETV